MKDDDAGENGASKTSSSSCSRKFLLTSSRKFLFGSRPPRKKQKNDKNKNKNKASSATSTCSEVDKHKDLLHALQNPQQW